MSAMVDTTIKNILACPYCQESLIYIDSYFSCTNCSQMYGFTESGALDLRLKKRKTVKLSLTIGESIFSINGCELEKLPVNKNSEVDFSNLNIPAHLSKEIMSHFPKARKPESFMLDIGCGNTIHRKVCEHAGFRYLGLDYYNENAQFLADAHALPFKSNSFEFILSIAVLEHIRFPFIMMQEAYRVIKKGGKFIGTVAFLEPFLGNSFYHHTHLGTFNSLNQGGFNIQYVCPNYNWSGLLALSKMCLFPKMPTSCIKFILLPLQILHKLWWLIGSNLIKRTPTSHPKMNTTGSFIFIAQK